ncbi:nuclear transport factor 2 family protein [Asanoa sp. WMMD1127]|uniref:nuclear transport factor 2 family protein n=1 Tax=Asanoa sp. WMMD1127 TaxID=3016107 RepID=UPI002417A8F0|nr:nuclear transport factor 2 family protein [Asanoa sp. WMMD1127]MDG4824855.1 nuclear transport factor 2 family protein [Asanoa sp. WMMD1127]
MLSTEDRFAIADVINMHGHLTDRGDFDAMPTLFTEDVTYDVSALGGGVLTGLADLRVAALELGEANPLAHHVTNIVLREAPDGTVHAMSKYLGVATDGSVASGTYDDTLRHGHKGWRITHRVIRPRRVPLQP